LQGAQFFADFQKNKLKAPVHQVVDLNTQAEII